MTRWCCCSGWYEPTFSPLFWPIWFPENIPYQWWTWEALQTIHTLQDLPWLIFFHMVKKLQQQIFWTSLDPSRPLRTLPDLPETSTPSQARRPCVYTGGVDERLISWVAWRSSGSSLGLHLAHPPSPASQPTPALKIAGLAGTLFPLPKSHWNILAWPQ